MTTGPRPTPHPIILHVDESNNPVRLAEASSIYVTSATIVSATITTLSATNYLGLDTGNAGVPGGEVGQIQYKKSSLSFGGDSALTFNESTQTLGAVQIIVGNFSSTTEAFFNNIARAEEFSSITLSATSSRIGQLSATTISAVTVCAVNYNSLFDALSFTNLDSRYLNSSGESVTGSFYLQNLSAALFSATTYLNLPSGAAVWNASALAGRPVTSTAPGQYEVLVFDGNAWVPSGIGGIAGAGNTPNGPENSIQFRVGSTFVGSGTAKFNTSFSGLELVNTSSTNLSSVNIRSTTISATDYLNIPSSTPLWNAKKLQDYDIVKGNLIDNDILSFTQTGGPGVGFFEKTTTTDYAAAIYPDLEPSIHANLPQTNASALVGYQVTSTAPINNQLLMYNGTAWVPTSSTFNLGTVNTTNSTASVLTVVTGTVTTLSSTSARITNLSATTISATTWQGLPSAVATWNASALQSGKVLGANTPAGQLGFLSYNPDLNEYQAISISSLGNDGIGNRGHGAASYLASANSNYFAINEGWRAFSDYPENKDVLVFSSNMYEIGTSRWTWQQASSLVPAVGGYEGLVQFRGPGGQFSSDAGIYFNPTTKILSVPNGIYSPDGSLVGGFITASGGGSISGTLRVQTVSATTYKLFGADTSAASPTLSNNQTIIYDTTATKWKPGYTVYQATGTPTAGLGSNGDIYFQYLP